ncbi:MAG: response regulator transcription factor [Actinobacteria bacterium]|nr:response regulator transcription factor [Actinomycetota bacterium]
MNSCLIADDHPPIVSALTRYLEENDFTVVGTAATGDEALEKLQRMHPQVALLDIRMPGLGGIDVVRRLREKTPETALVVYTRTAGTAELNDALDAGARGFVLKEAPLGDLVRALRTAQRGGVYIDPVVAGLTPTHERAVDLTKRERDVLRLLADGFPYDEVGRKLHISPETVRTHVGKACRRLGARSRTHAVAPAIRLSLIS